MGSRCRAARRTARSRTGRGTAPSPAARSANRTRSARPAAPASRAGRSGARSSRTAKTSATINPKRCRNATDSGAVDVLYDRRESLGMRLVLCVLVAALVVQPALADDYWYGQPDWRLTLRPYVGVGGSYVHHTGHDLDTPLKAEQWEIGGKAFGGIEITRQLNAELAFHYLNETQLVPTFAPWKESSYAVAGSLLLFTPPFFWPSEAFPYRS